MSGSILQESTMCFDKYYASYMIISSGPMKSRTKFFFKKAIFPVIKGFDPFSGIIKCAKSQGTFSNGPTCVGTITVEVIRSFL